MNGVAQALLDTEQREDAVNRLRHAADQLQRESVLSIGYGDRPEDYMQAAAYARGALDMHALADRIARVVNPDAPPAIYIHGEKVQ